MSTTMHLMPRPRADAIGCALPVPAGAFARALLALLGLLTALVPGARADDVPPLLGPDGLNGGRYVGSALSAHRPSLRFAAGLGYGFTESVLGNADHHHRVAGELSAAFVLAPWFQASLGGELRVDTHTPDEAGSQTGFLGSSRVSTRHVLTLGQRWGLGVSPSVQFPGADSVAHGFRAASYELVALVSARPTKPLELTLNAGYRFDRTRYAVEDAPELAPPQRLAASLSEQNAVLLGALAALTLAELRLGLEWSWQLQTAGPQRPLESPMRVRAVLQRVIGGRFLPGVELGVDTSSRPTFEGLMRLEPRVWVRLGLGVLLEKRPPTPRPAKPALPAAASAPAPEPVLHALTMHVVDANGQPVAGARVVVPGGGTYTTDALGEVTIQIPPGVGAVSIEAEGFEPASHNLEAGADVLPVRLEPALPHAEIKGAVRNLAGDALNATVTVLPAGLTVRTDALGQFAIAVAPGDYTLQIVADGYEPQERKAQVELRGVTIIVVDLGKASK